MAAAGLALFVTADAAGQGDVVTIRAGLLIDGTGDTTEDVRLFVEDGVITRIDRLRGNVTYDLSDFVVLPGLIDTHVHLTAHVDADGRVHPPMTRSDDHELILHAVGNAQRTLMAGFTTVQSLGSRVDALLRDHIARGVLWGPRVLASLDTVTAEIGDAEAIERFVQALAEDGADVIKIRASADMRDGGRRELRDAQIEAACQAAAAAGLRSVVHAHGSDVVGAVVRAGCTTVEHGHQYDEPVMEQLAAHGTYLDPYIGLVYDTYEDHRDAYFGTGVDAAGTLARLEDARRVGVQVFRRTRLDDTVRIVFGSDAGAGAHGRNGDELIARVEDGHQRPMDALVSATSLAATSLGVGDRIGTVAEGFAADLIAIAGNPLEDIGAIRRVRWVMKGGRVHRNEIGSVEADRGPRRR